MARIFYNYAMSKRVLCPKCHHIGKPAGKKRGSVKIELVGWFLLFPLGIPYTLWRIFSKIPVCNSCGHDMLIAENSIVGQRLIAKMENRIAPAEHSEKEPIRF